MINNNEPITYGAVQQWLATLLNKPADTSGENGSSTEASGANRFNGAELASPLVSEPSAKVESAYKPNEKLLGEEVARAVQFFPEAIIRKLEEKVSAREINPQAIEEFQIDLGRHVRVDTGASSQEAAQNGLGISPLTLLGDPTKESDNVLKIKQEDLNKIKSSIMFNPQSGRGGLEQVEDLSRFSISERHGLPANITIRVGKAIEAPLPSKIQEIVLGAVKNNKKVLFLGQTGVGKTTLIRQISKFLSDKGIVSSVFDKSEEITGHGLTPHSALGNLVRRFVPQPFKNVAQSLISMIENHNPRVLIIDELSDREQFSGVRRMIIEKGIPTVFIFTHGTTLGKAMHCENTKELLAEVKTVTVGDDTARLTGSKNPLDKTYYNVVGDSMVDVAVEMPARGVFVVHENVLDSMEKLAAGEEPEVEVYPKGTDIRNYRSEAAERFIKLKEAPDPMLRPARARNSQQEASSRLIGEAINQEQEEGSVRRPRPQRNLSHPPKGKIKTMSYDKLQGLHNQIASISESDITNRQRSLLRDLAAEIERRGIQQPG
jgi:hypothetical protein